MFLIEFLPCESNRKGFRKMDSEQQTIHSGNNDSDSLSLKLLLGDQPRVSNHGYPFCRAIVALYKVIASDFPLTTITGDDADNVIYAAGSSESDLIIGDYYQDKGSGISRRFISSIMSFIRQFENTQMGDRNRFPFPSPRTKRFVVGGKFNGPDDGQGKALI